MRFSSAAHLLPSSLRAVAAGISLALLALACNTGRPVRPKSAAVDQYLILATELEASKQANVYDAVRHLRPFWLRRNVRGRTGENTISIYVDEQFVGTLSALLRIPTFAVERVRYMSPTEAQTRFGQSNSGRAAILVESAKP
jgi:hypothetical protein